jgi:GntR family transcriptional repressor for pyruvate dehydrogenase complex
MATRESSTSTRVVEAILERIRSGEWPVGTLVPGERVMVDQLGVSRIALREALSMLRAMGVIETDHGRGSRVCRIDATILSRLVPLMVSLEGELPFVQVYEMRLALESRCAYMAALRRTDGQVRRLEELVVVCRDQMEGGEMEDAIATDMEFHMEIARAAHSPLFPLVLSVLSSLLTHVLTLSFKGNAVGRPPYEAHCSIAEAIRERDPERAQVEMESHLRHSALRILKSGVLRLCPASEPPTTPKRTRRSRKLA